MKKAKPYPQVFQIPERAAKIIVAEELSGMAVLRLTENFLRAGKFSPKERIAPDMNGEPPEPSEGSDLMNTAPFVNRDQADPGINSEAVTAPSQSKAKKNAQEERHCFAKAAIKLNDDSELY